MKQNEINIQELKDSYQKDPISHQICGHFGPKDNKEIKMVIDPFNPQDVVFFNLKEKE